MRARRTVGGDVVRPIANLDLDLELPGLSGRIRELTAAAPAEVDTLVFGIFDGISDDTGGFTGYHLAGARGFDPAHRWLPEPSWVPGHPALVSSSLDALAQLAGKIHGPARVVGAFEGGDCAEVTERRSVLRRSSVAAPLITRI